MTSLCYLQAVLVAAEDGQHVLSKRSGKPTKAPGSPTWRGTIKGPHGSQKDRTVDDQGHKTNGHLFVGKGARLASPPRIGQPHSGGQAGTSKGGK